MAARKKKQSRRGWRKNKAGIAAALGVSRMTLLRWAKASPRRAPKEKPGKGYNVDAWAKFGQAVNPAFRPAKAALALGDSRLVKLSAQLRDKRGQLGSYRKDWREAGDIAPSYRAVYASARAIFEKLGEILVAEAVGESVDRIRELAMHANDEGFEALAALAPQITPGEDLGEEDPPRNIGEIHDRLNRVEAKLHDFRSDKRSKAVVRIAEPTRELFEAASLVRLALEERFETDFAEAAAGLGPEPMRNLYRETVESAFCMLRVFVGQIERRFPSARSAPVAALDAGAPASEDSIAGQWRGLWSPCDRRPIYEVLGDELILGNESPFPGPFSIHNSPWIKEPFDALVRHETRRVLVSGAAQLAKTLLGLMWVIHCVRKRPGLTTWNGQTDDAIKKLAEDKAWPLFRRCRSIMALMPADSDRRRIRSVLFPHMTLRFQGANENNAHGDTVKNQINDERHLWQPGMIKKFDSRVAAMPSRKQLDLSTGSVKYGEQQSPEGPVIEFGDDFFSDWNDGTRKIWSVCCPECGRRQPLRWKHRDPDTAHDLRDSAGNPVFAFVWPENEITRPGGAWAFSQVKQSVRWKCRADLLGVPRGDGGGPCDFELADEPGNIRALNALESGAGYEIENPLADSSVESFRFPAMVSPLIGWGTLAVEWIRALSLARAGDFHPLKTFIQNRLAEAWDESVTVTTESNPTGDYDLDEAWANDAGEAVRVCRFLTIDRQRGKEGEGMHFWVCARDWEVISRGFDKEKKEHFRGTGRSRLVFYGKLSSYEECEAKRQELEVIPGYTLIDSGDEAREVYAQCCKYGWGALKGSEKESFQHIRGKKPVMKFYGKPIPGDPSGTGGRKKRGERALPGKLARVRLWSNPSVKDVLAALIAGNSSYWGRPRNEPLEYTEQLNSEMKKQVRDARGRYHFMWVQIKPGNHSRDCEAMQVVAALIKGFLFVEPEEQAAGEEASPRTGDRSAGGRITPPLNVPSRTRDYRLVESPAMG